MSLNTASFALGFPNKFFVPSVGRSGGLWLLWNIDTIINIVSSTPNYILTVISSPDKQEPPFHALFIYAPSHPRERSSFWNELATLGVNFSFCLIVGDFNEYSNSWGKWGKPLKEHHSRNSFNRLIQKLELEDLGSNGPRYTWSNKRCFKELVKARLDKCYGTASWSAAFKNVMVFNHPIIYSDHGAIHIDTSPLQ